MSDIKCHDRPDGNSKSVGKRSKWRPKGNMLDNVGSFYVGKMYYARNGGGNLESFGTFMLCGPPTMTRETMQFIRLQMK